MAEFGLRERTFQFSVKILTFLGASNLNAELRFLKIQLYRSSTSIGANVAEGSNGTSRKQLAQYFSIALRSANESIYWLKLIKEVIQGIDLVKLEELIQECVSITRILGKSISTLKTKTNVG